MVERAADRRTRNRGIALSVQKALPLFNDNGSIFMTGSNASLGAFPGWSLYAGSKAVQQAWARVWLNELRDRKIRVGPGRGSGAGSLVAYALYLSHVCPLEY